MHRNARHGNLPSPGVDGFDAGRGGAGKAQRNPGRWAVSASYRLNPLSQLLLSLNSYEYPRTAEGYGLSDRVVCARAMAQSEYLLNISHVENFVS